LNPSIKTLDDIWILWNKGWKTYPAVADLFTKYKRKWKASLGWTTAMKSHFARVKKIAEIASMATKALATVEQTKLYEWKGAASCDFEGKK